MLWINITWVKLVKPYNVLQKSEGVKFLYNTHEIISSIVVLRSKYCINQEQ